MARKMNLELLERKIADKKKEVVQAKMEWDKRTTELKELMDKRDAVLRQRILDEIVKSGLPLDEILRRICDTGSYD